MKYRKEIFTLQIQNKCSCLLEPLNQTISDVHDT